MPSGTAAAPAHTPFTSQYIIDPILPRKVVHVVSGPSCSGKTQWILQLLASMQQSQPILGYETAPVPTVFVSLKQSDAEIRDILTRCHIDPTLITYFCLPEHPNVPCNFAGVLAAALSTNPACQLLVVDGVDMIIPSGRQSDSQVINMFLMELREAIRVHSLTIVLMGPPPKAKDGDAYSNVRQRISGSVVWGTGTSTHINIEPTTAHPLDGSRRITISCRNSRPQIHDWRFDESGMLVEALEDDTRCALLAEWAHAQAADEVFTTGHILTIALSLGISKASMHRWLTAGGMTKVGHGEWKIAHTQ